MLSKSLFEFVTENPPFWANNVIENWENVFVRSGSTDMMDFVTCEVYEDMAQVDMRQVIGQWEHYAGQTWFEAASNPQYKPSKMRTMFRLYDENPSYYFSGKVANGICLSSLNNGPWFSVSGGNHRTIIAKFACERVFQETGVYPLISGVAKHQYYVDVEAWELFKQLRVFADHGIHVTVKRQRLEDRCLRGKKTIEYELAFHVADFRFNRNGRKQWLPTDEFSRFARYIVRQNAAVTSLERLRHYWLCFSHGDVDSLIYQS